MGVKHWDVRALCSMACETRWCQWSKGHGGSVLPMWAIAPKGVFGAPVGTPPGKRMPVQGLDAALPCGGGGATWCGEVNLYRRANSYGGVISYRGANFWDGEVNSHRGANWYEGVNSFWRQIAAERQICTEGHIGTEG